MSGIMTHADVSTLTMIDEIGEGFYAESAHVTPKVCSL
jgi:hypothetical protein